MGMGHLVTPTGTFRLAKSDAVAMYALAISGGPPFGNQILDGGLRRMICGADAERKCFASQSVGKRHTSPDRFGQIAGLPSPQFAA